MIKHLFEKAGIEITSTELEEVLQIATDDIRENRIKFNKKTSLQQMFTIALRSYRVLKKAAWKGVFEHDYGYKEAVNKVKYELDGDNVYDPETGETLNSIDEVTQNQLEEILDIKKTLW